MQNHHSLSLFFAAQLAFLLPGEVANPEKRTAKAFDWCQEEMKCCRRTETDYECGFMTQNFNYILEHFLDKFLMLTTMQAALKKIIPIIPLKKRSEFIFIILFLHLSNTILI